MAGLSTHILDTSIGKPAANVKIELFEDNNPQPTVTCTTNSDGRTDEPLIRAGHLKAGTYELRFHAGDYFKRDARSDSANGSVPFLDIVVIRFGIGHTDQHYHVKLIANLSNTYVHRRQ